MICVKLDEEEKKKNLYWDCIWLVICLALMTILFLISCSFAGDFEIKAKYTDYAPGDGFFDAGTQSNPYVIKNSYNEPIGEIKPKYYDYTPNDGYMDKGTNQNPYIIKWGDR